MKPLTKGLILLVVIGFYSLLYIATTPPERCFDDCQKIYQLDTTLSGKYNYFKGAFRCDYFSPSDTLCIYVRDTSGVNWDRFADTICLYANSFGLSQQKLILLKSGSGRLDTVAKKVCP